MAVPPAGFNAVTAAQSEREAYGIPPEPAVTETAAHTRWEQEIHNFHPSTPPKALYMPVRPVGATNSSALTSELTPPGSTLEEGDGGFLAKTTREGCSACWAGYVDTGELKGVGPKVPPFNEAGIVYKEPQRLDDCEGTHASPWVGLGGYGSEPLDQAGTELGKGDGIAEHQVWIENYEEPVEEEDEAIPLEFYATPGADLQVTVTHDSGNEYSVSFYNFATSKWYGPVTRKSRKTFKGVSAEYIMERPGEAPLADFGKWEVAEAWAEGNHTDGPESFEHHAETIYAGKRRVASTSGLSYPESGREFYVTWEGYSESNTCTPEDPVPTVTTEPATEVKATSAVLHGAVDPNNGDTHYYFEYGTTTSYGNMIPVEPQDIGSGTSPVSVENTVTNLNPDTEYHDRLVALNDAGTSEGADQTFRTTKGSFTGSDLADLIMCNNNVYDVALSNGKELGVSGSGAWSKWACSRHAVVGDFTGNGEDDIAVPNESNNTWAVGVSNGAGSLEGPGSTT